MERRKSEQPFGSSNGRPGPPAARPPRAPGRPRPRPARAGRPPGERFDARLDAILAATTVLFAREGYHQASMRDVAAAAGVSLANLYHYIDSKERLLFLIQFRAFSGLLARVQAALVGVREPAEQLRVLVHTHVLYAVQNLASLKVCSHELDSLTGEAHEEVRRVRREYYDLARGVIGRLLDQRPDGPPLDERVATMTLFGALNWLYRWYDPARERSPASLAAQIHHQFHAAFTRPPTPPDAPAGPAPQDGPAPRRRRPARERSPAGA